jgi:wyosine [tRNA(Phe)-imidazoG37] synthetase (radical SAM superfamily)
MMKEIEKRHLYGPVPSRRLGLSLGVDVVPYKVCSYDCVYCQLGRTTGLTNKPGAWIRTDDVIPELEKWLADGHTADYITFSGSGEPTLNAELGEMVRRASLLCDIPIAVITNGSLLSQRAVFEAVRGADLLLPSLDAGTEETFEAVNRPCEGLDFGTMVDGLTRLGREFRGRVWLEVMLVKGLNDSEAELEAMRRIIDRVQPDKVQINTVERPSRSGDVAAVPDRALSKAREVLGPASEVISTRRVCAGSNHAAELGEEALLELLARRPCRLGDITAGTSLHPNEAIKMLHSLMSRGLVEAAVSATDPHYRLASRANEAIELVVTAVPVAPGDTQPETGETIHLEARPVEQGRARAPSTTSSGKWLDILGRVTGAIVTLLTDRAVGVDRPSRTTRYGIGGCSPKRLRRRKRPGR